LNLLNDIEYYGMEILDLFGQTAFSDKLLLITVEKGNDFILDNFSCRKYGWANVEAELPVLYVMGLREELIKDEGNCRWQWFKYAIEVYIAGDNTEQLEKKVNRYARAIDEMLIAKYRDDGMRTAIEYSPVFKYEDSLFKVCSILFQLKVFQDIT